MSPERKEQNDAEIARSRQAQALISDPLFAETFKNLKQEIIDKWAACPARDTEGREWLWQHYQVALKFEETLTSALNTGKLALKEREMSLVERAVSIVRR